MRIKLIIILIILMTSALGYSAAKAKLGFSEGKPINLYKTIDDVKNENILLTIYPGKDFVFTVESLPNTEYSVCSSGVNALNFVVANENLVLLDDYAPEVHEDATMTQP